MRRKKSLDRGLKSGSRTNTGLPISMENILRLYGDLPHTVDF
jgi:hypothetical protein